MDDYDAWNRLVAVHKAYDNSLVATYVYDGLGRRIEKTVGDTITDYYYDISWRVVEERQSVGSGETAVTAQYLWSGGAADTPVIKWADYNGDEVVEATPTGLRRRVIV
jgi:YD repeat-containing protein